MLMNVLAIAIVAGLAYTWGTRGGFSSLLNCICVVLAGALAYGLWEPTATALLNNAPTRGAGTILADVAWGLGLALPFAISLAVLRAITDVLVRKNLKFKPAADWAVGAVFGAIAGIVVSGVCVQSISGLRAGREALGYSAIESDAQGNIVKASTLWVPTDRLTAQLYKHLSVAAFSSPEPLQRWNPDPAVFAASTRQSFSEGKGSNSLRRDDFEVVGRYVLDPATMVAPPPPPPTRPGTPSATGASLATNRPTGNPMDLFSDSVDTTSQRVRLLDGSNVDAKSRLHGVIIRFKSGAKERTSAQVVVGNGQVYLIAENSAGTRRLFFPSAVVAKAAAGKVAIARFRFDAKDTHIASQGGDSESNWAFEFFVPPEFEPIGVVVKGTRVRFPGVEALTPVAFENRLKRDALIAAGQLTSGRAGGTIDESKAVQITASGGEAPAGLSVSNSVGFTLQDGTLGSAMVVRDNRIVSGTATLRAADVDGTRGIDQALRVERFVLPDQTAMVSIDVSLDRGEAGLTGTAAREATGDEPKVPAAPFVVDSNGVRYDAVGFIYRDESQVQIQYIVGEPIRSVTEIPVLSRSRPQQRMRLLFTPSVGVDIVGWGVGNRLVAKYVPPIRVENAR